jgi:hypothetical protein
MIVTSPDFVNLQDTQQAGHFSGFAATALEWVQGSFAKEHSCGVEFIGQHQLPSKLTQNT